MKHSSQTPPLLADSPAPLAQGPTSSMRLPRTRQKKDGGIEVCPPRSLFIAPFGTSASISYGLRRSETIEEPPLDRLPRAMLTDSK
ncbi:Hypothetical protein NTJ_06318 [Nesidiocoris tenuis]|uniref:Uncharacterized protein n=1 Tax=Nesidiocoris tenuis TaxID=355587 RepID=A0ABN7AMQ6_9HEMI|nr:Hypothetical protein NTJ_06318 [Nesidiocoris tenuis]